jgi:hypothetical protein
LALHVEDVFVRWQVAERGQLDLVLLELAQQDLLGESISPSSA